MESEGGILEAIIVAIITGTFSLVGSIIAIVATTRNQAKEMDKKLDDLTSQMAAMQATAEFNTRAEKAMMLRDNWRTFRTNYMENTMDKQMSEYRAMLLNGLQSWCWPPRRTAPLP